RHRSLPALRTPGNPIPHYSALPSPQYACPFCTRDHVYRRRARDIDDRGAPLMAAYERVAVEIVGGIATVTLSRPDKLNAFDRAMCDDVLEALRMVVASEQVRVVILTGAGRAFCAGADLNVLAEDGAALVAAGKELALLIRGAPEPVLAAA